MFAHKGGAHRIYIIHRKCHIYKNNEQYSLLYLDRILIIAT